MRTTWTTQQAITLYRTIEALLNQFDRENEQQNQKKNKPMMDADPGLTAFTEMSSRDLVAKMSELSALNVQTEMPRYKCHKQVWALKIKAIKDPTEPGNETDGSRIIIPEEQGFAPFRVEHDYVRKHNPEVGGYYVVYSDGYKSFSPAKAFEDGYERI